MILPRVETRRFSLALLLTVLLLAACSGGSGGGGSDVQSEPDFDTIGDSFVYSGPAPVDSEVQSFKREFYDRLVANDRCGSCHNEGGVGGLDFVDRTDVNNAWREANRVVNLTDPGDSAIVAKVAGGHQCWEGSAASLSCAQLIETYIERWAASVSGNTTEVVLTPRSFRALAGTRQFPADPASVPAFSAAGGVHELLTSWCAGCHSDTAAVRQAPFFASDDIAVAYAAAIGKIDLNTPANSRLVVRLRDESHNCVGDCASNAAAMLTAIEAIADSIPVTEIDPALLISLGQNLDLDGIAVSAGGRYEENIIARWNFGEGSGTTAVDTSGVGDILLNLSGDYEWLGIGGIRFLGGRAQASISDSQFIRSNLAATGEYSIELWVTPFNVVQENATIISYAGGASIRNLAVNQSLYNYQFFNRSLDSAIDGAGAPAVQTADADEVAQAALQHVVATYDPVNGRQLFVNGSLVAAEDPANGASLANWNDSFALVLGNDPSGSNGWRGNLRYAAIHNRALSPGQITQNFAVGIGQVYYLLFSVSELIDEPGVCHQGSGASRVNYCYIAFEVSQLDSWSYLFKSPFFVTLNNDAFPADFSLRGIRIGINGKLADVGQAFVNVDETVTAGNYGADGQLLADIGTIISLQLGPAQDLFFLAFEDFAGQSGVTTPAANYSFSYRLGEGENVAIGLRRFAEIDAAYAAITTVPSGQLWPTFASVQRSLPAVTDVQAYSAAQQMAATQLAIAYCDALVEDAVRRTSYFNDGTAFNFNQQADAVSDAVWLNRVIYPLLDRSLVFAGADPLELANTQPSRASVAATLLDLITDTADNRPYELVNGTYQPLGDGLEDGLARCDAPGENDTPCSVARTGEVVKAVCATVLASAVVGLK